jgi:nitroreductase
MNEVLSTIKNRRSVRSFKSEQISQEILDEIIKAGIYAPSGSNQQPWHFTVIQNKDLINKINFKAKELMTKSDIEWVKNAGTSDKYHLSFNSPTLVIVSGRTEAITWKADCAAAIQNMLLAAHSLEVGSVWLGMIRYFFAQPEEVKALNIPEGYEPFYGVALGYSTTELGETEPKRNMDVVSYIK